LLLSAALIAMVLGMLLRLRSEREA